MQSTVRERRCYTKDCAAQAEYACMRCGKPLCAAHAHLLRLERRLSAREDTHDLPSLARLPSQIKLYAFCARCC
jgi:hypothetical protein